MSLNWTPHPVLKVPSPEVQLSMGAEMANTRLELVHPRTLQTVWVSDTFDRLCAGDRLDLLAGTRS